MNSSFRLYHCARCHKQVIICRRCDYGRVYCGDNGSKPARAQSRKRAAMRYQRSRRGRHANAERQRRFRARKRQVVKKVTHQGSPPDVPNVLLPREANQRQDNQKPVNQPVKEPLHCHFCGCEGPQFLRLGFVRQKIRQFNPKKLNKGEYEWR